MKYSVLQKPRSGYSLTNEDGTSKSSVVFLHDALGSALQWQSFPKSIANALPVDVYVYNRQGHDGQISSPKYWGEDYLHREAEELHRLVTDLGLQKPVLIGSSDGGSIAWIYASKYPVKALVSMAGHYKVDQETVEGVLNTGESLKPLIQKLVQYHGANAQALVTQWYKRWTSPEFKSWSIKPLLEQINCPCLHLQGDKDSYASAQHHLEAAEFIGANAKAITLDNTGHFPHIEHQAVTIHHIKQFLEAVLR
ncbi:MAG: hypothetical protein CR968_01690 [Flavobacteriia bacterium]|nr:MAG: hypothetical protein CR968_01690 [Flavobacteriia bacterium]